MSDGPNQLHYQPRESLKRRKCVNRVIVCFVVVLIVVIAIRLGPVAAQRARILYWQHECMQYTFKPDEVVYDDRVDMGSNPQNAAILPFDKFFSEAGFGYGQVAIFLHQRETPDGKQRLIFTTFDWQSFGPLNILSRVIRPANFTHTAEMQVAEYRIPIEPKNSAHTWIYAGQADPKDASHFTIDVITRSPFHEWSKTVIDGWLRNDEEIVLQARPPVAIPIPSTLPAKSP